ncbi:DEAD/DEAH box helicase [Synechococcus sp. CS-602]|uniref:DEAD/DEAH box helicase n=1 Tax=Synechococcaceae TaxID=1890426 RepID=UPI0008FF5134|nr:MULTISPECIES: DEAD/DEAH box helicase [Synechococcaceae]MCT4365040.1 DEAD/DEAH box helicase [Candidatus Regnicoccus frigidus MAG-AL1]APD47891.1 helicase [Synechococcus sp. SynAce01]MCT0203008.1 DEAD/DEAH box helicase [Synechococcus sp. CS-603]MCT0204647.1 DEAD/DEAH box helicase [Synechococcus sp. CS-602]MCT0245268.1 DEAD/DEAH box helicase [Synechococcus sp. CS-601]
MSLLHATWLPADSSGMAVAGLMLWADTWRVAHPASPIEAPLAHPLSLNQDDLGAWLEEWDLWTESFRPASAALSLPSRRQSSKGRKKSEMGGWSGLPLQAGEPIPKDVEWWPWEVEGLWLDPAAAALWLERLPLSGNHPDLADELRWWSHLQRWSLSLIARGRWLPQVEEGQAHWLPLLNREDDRRRLEDLATQLPQVAVAGLCRGSNLPGSGSAWAGANGSAPLACWRPGSGRLRVVTILSGLVDAQLRSGFSPKADGLDPLLTAWQQALGPGKGELRLGEEEIERLGTATHHWREAVAGRVAPARACLELDTPPEGAELWELRFSLQAEADPSLKLPAAAVWAAGEASLQLGEINVQQPGELLLEGLGRALQVFEPIGRGLDAATPLQMELAPAEAFVLVRTAAARLRDVGVGVVLPPSLSGGLASRLGLSIEAELPAKSRGFSLGETLEWRWDLMIGGVTLTLKDLERLASKRSPLVQHKGAWIELRPGDLRNAEKFCALDPPLSLDDALRLTGNEGETLQRLPVHRFTAGPRLQGVLEQYHQQKAPDPLPAPEGFCGQLRPYQERGLGWLAFLHRFDHGACLADDMGLGKTIQLLAFLQHLKSEQELKRPVLLVAPTSVLTNWKREATGFTPELTVLEHYGPRRPATPAALAKALKGVDLVLTSYGLLQRDSELLASMDWQGTVIDEAQAIKNPSAKQSLAARQLARSGKTSRFRIALTGTPVENRVSELWALMDFLNPTVLGDEEFFRQRYRLPIERYGDTASLRDIKARVGPFVLRRLKTDKSIISDLPEKLELSEWVGLSSEQSKLYRKTVDETLDAIARAPLGQKHGQVLGLLTKLKQICNHPALALKEGGIGEGFSARSAKLQRLEEIVDEVIEAGDRALLFTQFAEWGHLLKAHLEKRFRQEVPFLYGSTSKVERQAMVDRFQDDPRGPQLFLLSLKAGGVGLNLTRASHVFHIDRWWNPAVENQATDRAYRIGQTNRVLVHKFITSGSVEEKIDRMIREKARLAEDIIGSGEEWLGGLDPGQLRDLVALND